MKMWEIKGPVIYHPHTHHSWPLLVNSGSSVFTSTVLFKTLSFLWILLGYIPLQKLPLHESFWGKLFTLSSLWSSHGTKPFNSYALISLTEFEADMKSFQGLNKGIYSLGFMCRPWFPGSTLGVSLARKPFLYFSCIWQLDTCKCSKWDTDIWTQWVLVSLG